MISLHLNFAEFESTAHQVVAVAVDPQLFKEAEDVRLFYRYEKEKTAMAPPDVSAYSVVSELCSIAISVPP